MDMSNRNDSKHVAASLSHKNKASPLVGSHCRKRAKQDDGVEDDIITVVQRVKADNAHNLTITLEYDLNLLAKMVYPIPCENFLASVFRRHALHVSHGGNVDRLREFVIEDGLFQLDLQSVFRETCSENVFAWIQTKGQHVKSIEVDNPDSAYTLYQAGHATYCRAPAELEQPLVSSMLRGTGMGCGQYDPSGSKMTTLGRGEVEVFAGTLGHFTNWHTDFQENFTLQLSGSKKWRFKHGTVINPLRGCTPHYSAPDTVESQLKASRLTRPNFQFGWPENENLNNSVGEVKEVIMQPGDMLYFPAGMWHSVETLEEGISINISLMATTYASLVSSALQHILLKQEGWNEAIVDNSHDGGPHNAVEKLNSLLQQLPDIVKKVVNENGTGSILPEPLRQPQSQSFEIYSDGESDSDKADKSIDGNANENGTGSILPEPLRQPQSFVTYSDGEMDKDEADESIDGYGESDDDDANASIDGDCESDDDELDESIDGHTEEGVRCSLNGVSNNDGESDHVVIDSPVDGSNSSGTSGDQNDPIVSIKDFTVPTSYPVSFNVKKTELKRNPLASLTKMTDVAGFYEKSGSNSSQHINDVFILNMSFGGNEALESQLRIILRDSTGEINAVCQHEMSGELDIFKARPYDEKVIKTLVYYGYFVASEDIRLKV